MIECIFTIDYEIYGNGEGSLRELVYEPAKKLFEIFMKRNIRFVSFVEVAEFEMIESQHADPAIELVKQQIRTLHEKGFELGLHLHPQWYNGRYENGRWLLDYSEYNLCTLPRVRIAEIINRAIAYLRNTLKSPEFIPLSFRAGNWLFQPTATAAQLLADNGLKIDSSVFKGGMQHEHKLNYYGALSNGSYWRFSEDVNVPDPNGIMLEIPIMTRMTPAWKMLTGRRVGMQQKRFSKWPSNRERLYRLLDYCRLSYPLKFDFCRMTLLELTSMVDAFIKDDRNDPQAFRPIVAIGHTKDGIEPQTVESFLDYLAYKDITISTFNDIYAKCY